MLTCSDTISVITLKAVYLIGQNKWRKHRAMGVHFRIVTVANLFEDDFRMK